MKEGKVKFFNYQKGFGFITPADTAEDIFVHTSGLIDNINEGDNVTYDESQGKKGLNAINVKVIG